MDEIRATRINLSPEVRTEIIANLNLSLANTIYAALAAKFAHWNVKGTGFLPTHRFFDEVATFYNESADTIAERITALGGDANGEMHDVAAESTVTYESGENDNCKEHMGSMANLLGTIANMYRAGIKLAGDQEDFATQDVYIELCREADKLLYFMEAALRNS